MKIKNIEYKLATTDQLKCHKCGEGIEGKEGYLKFSFERTRGYFPLGERSLLLICWKCFAKLVEEVEVKRKTRKGDYEKLLKQRILMKLK